MILILFKLLFLFGANAVELPAEEIGWVAVERFDKEEHPLGADETDPSIWVVFAKEIGNEKFLVSFPKEPTYKYLNEEGSEMELFASCGGAEHVLQVLLPSENLLEARKESLQGAIHFFEKKDETGTEIIYWKGGYWFMERLVSLGTHSYILQTKTVDFENQAHSLFSASLDIEKK